MTNFVSPFEKWVAKCVASEVNDFTMEYWRKRQFKILVHFSDWDSCTDDNCHRIQLRIGGFENLFVWVGHFEFFFASFPWKQVKVYWLARMGQNFDQAKCDNTFWPMPNILKGSVPSVLMSKKISCASLDLISGSCCVYASKRDKNYAKQNWKVYKLSIDTYL